MEHIKDILSAIQSVRNRATTALAQGDLQTYSCLMLDLLALERCLVYQTEALVSAA